MAFNQIPKQKIDIGQIGNPSTGDILYDGGGKLNSNLDALYNTFGDQRLYNLGIDIGNQVLHATGYYQKATALEFRTPVPLGSMYDVDTTNGSVNPVLPKGKKGEGVIFVNYNGSLSVNRPMIIQASDGGSFVGVSGALVITAPYSKVECWCIDDTGGEAVWNYKLTSLFGIDFAPIDKSYLIGPIVNNIQLSHISEYSSMKLLLTASNNLGTVMRSSEVNLLIDLINKKVYTTEYAVLQYGLNAGQPELLTFEFAIDTQGYVSIAAKSTYTNIKLAVKTLAVQKIGAT